MNAAIGKAVPLRRPEQARSKDEVMKTRAFAALPMTGLVLLLGACASPEPPAAASQAAPPQTAPQLRPTEPAAAPAPSPGEPAKPMGATVPAKSPHRQYLDQRTGRYYYFDAASHRYYWEDGSPRY